MGLATLGHVQVTFACFCSTVWEQCNKIRIERRKQKRERKLHCTTGKLFAYLRELFSGKVVLHALSCSFALFLILKRRYIFIVPLSPFDGQILIPSPDRRSLYEARRIRTAEIVRRIQLGGRKRAAASPDDTIVVL